MKIFISHSHKDKKLINEFVEKILMLGCGIDYPNIFCSSIDGLGIKTGEDFREHIRTKLLDCDFIFLFISANYKQSEICLNEMGASWVLDNKRIIPLIFPNLDFDSLGTLFGVKQGAKINDSSALDGLHEEIVKAIGTTVKIAWWNKHKSDFLEFLEHYSFEPIDTAKPLFSNAIYPNEEEYFSKYLIENISINQLFLHAQPRLIDCESIFSKQFYLIAYTHYCELYKELEIKQIKPLFPKYKAFRIVKTDQSEKLRRK
jgi:hypothetical protein